MNIMMSPERFVHYKVGIAEIDADHWDMMVKSNEVIRLINQHRHDDAFELLLVLYHHVKEHCTKEENLMRGINYKWIIPHIHEHEKILFRLAELDVTQASPDYQIKSFAQQLEELLVDHIDHTDMQYTDDINQYADAMKFYVV